MVNAVREGRLGSLFYSVLVGIGLDWSGLRRFGQGAPPLILKRADKVVDKVVRQSAGHCGGYPHPLWKPSHRPKAWYHCVSCMFEAVPTAVPSRPKPSQCEQTRERGSVGRSRCGKMF